MSLSDRKSQLPIIQPGRYSSFDHPTEGAGPTSRRKLHHCEEEEEKGEKKNTSSLEDPHTDGFDPVRRGFICEEAEEVTFAAACSRWPCLLWV